jgi:hypothetical protein
MDTKIIAVHIGDLVIGPLAAEAFPPKNLIGMLLLWRLLSLALSKAGLLAEPAGGRGELNDCTFMASVTDTEAAAIVLKEELALIGLLDVSQIGIARDGGWRCVYPSASVRLNWLLDGERQDLVRERLLAAVAKLRANLPPSSPPDQEDSPPK